MLLACAPGMFGVAHAEPPFRFPLAEGQVMRVGPVAGTGTGTRDYDVGATDLCEFMEFPTEVLQICGDSFPGQGVGLGRDYSPIALRLDASATGDLADSRYLGVVGVHEPLLADPTPAGTSQLPAGVVQINRRNYLLVTTTAALVPQTSRLVYAEPARGGWQSVAGSWRDGAYQDGRQSQISGYYDPIPAEESATGWVYIVANNFDRSAPVSLYRATRENFTDRSSWQGWADGRWGRGAPAPLFNERVGEFSVRQIDGKTVLSYFNSGNGDMEVRVAAGATSLGSAPVTTVVRHDEWPEPAEALPLWPFDNRLAQPYGGYIAPGSTLDELRIFVSQWHNSDPRQRAPYRVIEFAVNPFKPPW